MRGEDHRNSAAARRPALTLRAMDRTIDQYLQRHAEPEALQLTLTDHPALKDNQHYQNVLVIPAFAESANFLAGVLKHCGNSNLLSIVVVNAPDNPAIEPQQISATTKLLSALKHSEQTPLLVIDRASLGKRIPPKQGVGLARKIGSDIALRLYRDGQVTSSWLCQTDADACLPKDYFAALSAHQGTVVFSHEHVSEDPLLTFAATLYDAHMQYYVQALANQGSPYAYPTLGSTIAVDAISYAQARGFPKRNAGEDFHFLNKLNKLQPITWLQQPTIKVQARRSTRVVFGTGPALEKIITLLQDDPSGIGYLSYDHQCFELLGKGLDYLRLCSQHPKDSNGSPAESADHARVVQIFQHLGIDKVINDKFYQQPSPEQRLRLLTDWFDALKTLRFVHRARDFFPDTSLLRTLAQLPASYATKLRSRPE